jgi:hypothetical protein
MEKRTRTAKLRFSPLHVCCSSYEFQFRSEEFLMFDDSEVDADGDLVAQAKKKKKEREPAPSTGARVGSKDDLRLASGTVPECLAQLGDKKQKDQEEASVLSEKKEGIDGTSFSNTYTFAIEVPIVEKEGEKDWSAAQKPKLGMAEVKQEVVEMKLEQDEKKRRNLFKPTAMQKGTILQFIASRTENNFLVGKNKGEKAAAVLKALKKQIPDLTEYCLRGVVSNALSSFEAHLEAEAKTTGGGVVQMHDMGTAIDAIRKIYNETQDANAGLILLCLLFFIGSPPCSKGNKAAKGSCSASKGRARSKRQRSAEKKIIWWK